MKQHGEAVTEMKKEGMTLHPTDQSYFDAYNAQVVQAQDALAKEDAFYKEIIDSQRAYAEKVNSYLSNSIEADLKIMRATKNTNNIPNN